LWQTLTDWELIVVGDACTDDTAEVVASFGDERIQFVNLERNVGEQSGPNNEGVRRARGRYVAFLNHDDLWLPHHLETLVDAIDRSGAGLVFSLLCVVEPGDTHVLGCVTATGRYELYTKIPASAWLVRRDVAERVGPWRFYQELYVPPSQDWLQRAYRAGVRLELVPRVTVVSIQSGARAGSYANRDEAEHHEYFERMRSDPRFLETALTAIALRHTSWDPSVGARLAVRPYLARAAMNLLRAVLVPLGMPPGKLRAYLTHGRKGGIIDRMRRTRGLPPLPRK